MPAGVRRTAALAVALALAGPACWSRTRIGDERIGGALAKGDPRVLVVPLNVSVHLAAGLEAAVEPVHDAILDHLHASGARVSFLAVEDAGPLWRRAVRTLRSLERNTASLQVVAGTFTRSLHGEVDFDLLLMPSLGYREAGVERGYAIWDGVRRSLTARQQQWSLRERVPAYSLHAQLYLPDGRLWLQRWAGLDLVYESDLDGEPALRPDQVRESLPFIREGVAVALSLDGAMATAPDAPSR